MGPDDQARADANKERAYIAASRRGDRSLEARVKSAHDASKIHEKRTGRPLHITEEIVAKEEMYEEVDDHMPSSYHPGNRYAAFPPGSLRDRFETNHSIQAYRRDMSPRGMMNPQLDVDFERHFGQILGRYTKEVSDSTQQATQYPQAARGPSSRNPHQLSISDMPTYPATGQQQSSPSMDTMFQYTPGPPSASSQLSFAYGNNIMSPVGSQVGSPVGGHGIFDPPRLARTDSMQSNQSFGPMTGNGPLSPIFNVHADAHGLGQRSNSMPFNNVSVSPAPRPMDRALVSHEGHLESSPHGATPGTRGRFHSRHNSAGSIHSLKGAHVESNTALSPVAQAFRAYQAAQQQQLQGPGYPFTGENRTRLGSQSIKRPLATTPGTEYGPAKVARPDSEDFNLVTNDIMRMNASLQLSGSTMPRPQRFDLNRQSQDDMLKMKALQRRAKEDHKLLSQAQVPTKATSPVVKNEESKPVKSEVASPKVKLEIKATPEDGASHETQDETVDPVYASDFDNATFPFNVGINEGNYFDGATDDMFAVIDENDVGQDNFNWDDFLNIPSSQQNS